MLLELGQLRDDGGAVHSQQLGEVVGLEVGGDDYVTKDFALSRDMDAVFSDADELLSEM